MTKPDQSSPAPVDERLLAIWQSLESELPPPHTSVVIPSLSFDSSELEKIQGVPFYEERLLFSLIRLRDPRATVIYVTSQPLHPDIIDYYLGLLRGVSRRGARARLHLFCTYDSAPISLTRKILDRPRIVARIREHIRDPERAYLTCFTSTELERELATQLGIPLNGVDPELLWAGSKSGSRRIFDLAGVEQTPGFEDLHSEEELVTALAALKRKVPQLTRAVLKLDESFAGAGNAIFHYPAEEEPSDESLRGALGRLARTSETQSIEDYLGTFVRMGGIAEAFVEREPLESPSVQLRVNPDRSVALISTHDQVLGGPTGQTYLGCRFPADPRYRQQIQEEAYKVGRSLRDHGVVSRFGVDFLTFPDGEGWRSLAVEINLRMGGTTAPFLALQFLTGGQLDPESGNYLSAAGESKFYYATDNLRSPSYRGLLPEDFADILAAHRLDFDPYRETGAIFHMIGSLSQFGKIGVTCIGNSPGQADEIYHRVVEILDREGVIEESPAARPLHPFEAPVSRME